MYAPGAQPWFNQHAAAPLALDYFTRGLGNLAVPGMTEARQVIHSFAAPQPQPQYRWPTAAPPVVSRPVPPPVPQYQAPQAQLRLHANFEPQQPRPEAPLHRERCQTRVIQTVRSMLTSIFSK